MTTPTFPQFITLTVCMVIFSCTFGLSPTPQEQTLQGESTIEEERPTGYSEYHASSPHLNAQFCYANYACYDYDYMLPHNFAHMNRFNPSPASDSCSDVQECASIIKMGPGYYSAQFLEWIGTKLLNGIESTVVRVRLVRHRRNITRFSLDPRKSVTNEKAVISFVYDALEMASGKYSVCDRQRIRLLTRKLCNCLSTSYSGMKKFRLSTQFSLFILDLSVGHSTPPDIMDIIDEITGRLVKVPLDIATFDQSVWDGVVTTVDSLARMLLSLGYDNEIDPGWILVAKYFSEFIGKITLDYPGRLPAVTLGIFRELGNSRCTSLESGCFTKKLRRPWDLLIFSELASIQPELINLVNGPYGLPGICEALYQTVSTTLDWSLEEIYQAVVVAEILLGKKTFVTVEVVVCLLELSRTERFDQVPNNIRCLLKKAVRNSKLSAPLIYREAFRQRQAAHTPSTVHSDLPDTKEKSIFEDSNSTRSDNTLIYGLIRMEEVATKDGTYSETIEENKEADSPAHRCRPSSGSLYKITAQFLGRGFQNAKNKFLCHNGNNRSERIITPY